MKLMIATVLLSVASFVLNVVAADAMLIDVQVSTAISQLLAKEQRVLTREAPNKLPNRSAMQK